MDQARRPLLAIVALLALASPVLASQPADGWLAAYKDAKSLPPEEAKYTRYLWMLDDEPKVQWLNYIAVSGWLQAISRNRRIVQPVAVMKDGSVRVWPLFKNDDWGKIACLRVSVLRYWPDASVWDKLGDSNLEPYFHVTTIVPKWITKSDGYQYYQGDEKTTAIAPWLLSPLGATQEQKKECREAVFGLLELTDYSPCPIVEVRNWIWQTSVQFDRPAGYYEWLGVKDRKTFQELVGFDPKASLNFAYPQLEAVSDSGVAHQPRGIEFWASLGGAYIFTQDQVEKRAQGKRNPLVVRNLGDLDYAAEEVFAMGANRWWKVGLFNKNGTRQDSAPDGVGYMHQARGNDGKIHVGLSCFVCHDRKPGNGGLQPFTPYFRTEFAVPGPIALANEDPKKLAVLEEFYLTSLNLDPHRRAYTEAVYEACGLTPDKWSAYLYDVYWSYERPVDFPRAAVEFGVSEAELVRSMGTTHRFFGKIDTINGNWILAPERRMKIGRDQFAEFYNLGQLGLRGLPTWPPELRHKFPLKGKP